MLLERIVKKWGRKCFSVFNPENRIFYEFWENILFIHQIFPFAFILFPFSFIRLSPFRIPIHYQPVISIIMMMNKKTVFLFVLRIVILPIGFLGP